MGQAFIFVPLVALTGLFAPVVLAHVARSLLVVVEHTAAGHDQVQWPDEPVADWLLRAVHLLWLVAFWLVPTGLAVAALKPATLGLPPATCFIVPAGFCLWLFFPVTLLSSMSGPSKMALFRPALIAALFKDPRALATFYGLTGLLLGGCAAIVAAAIDSGYLWAAPLAGAAVSTTILLYARLLGRLGWLAGRNASQPLNPPDQKKEGPEPERPRKKKRKRPAAPPAPETRDPWAVPGEGGKRKKKRPEPPARLPVSGYGVAREDAPSEPDQPYRRHEDYDIDWEPIPVKEEPKEENAPPAEEKAPQPLDHVELQWQESRKEPPAPERPLFSGVWTFPLYETSLAAWFQLGLESSALLALIILMFAFFPPL
jgi:hypothetical protein